MSGKLSRSFNEANSSYSYSKHLFAILYDVDGAVINPNLADVDSETLADYEKNPFVFPHTYGDGVIHEAEMGEYVLFDMKITRRNETKAWDKEIAVNAQLAFKQVVGATLDSTEKSRADSFNETYNKSVTITSHGGYRVDKTTSEDGAISDIWNGFDKYTQEKRNGTRTPYITAMAYSAIPYDLIIEDYFKTTALLKYRTLWANKQSSYLDMMLISSHPPSQNLAERAWTAASYELDLCMKRNPACRAPTASEFDYLDNYREYVQPDTLPTLTYNCEKQVGNHKMEFELEIRNGNELWAKLNAYRRDTKLSRWRPYLLPENAVSEAENIKFDVYTGQRDIVYSSKDLIRLLDEGKVAKGGHSEQIEYVADGMNIDDSSFGFLGVRNLQLLKFFDAYGNKLDNVLFVKVSGEASSKGVGNNWCYIDES